MKRYSTLGIGIVLFVAGLLIGREYFPNSAGDDGTGTVPEKNKRAVKPLFEGRRGADGETVSNSTNRAASASASSVAEVMALVDASDAFMTGQGMRDALGQMGADDLEGLLSGFEDHPKTAQNYYAARSNVFNYFAMADPERALAYTLEHSDEQFRQTFTAIAFKFMARSDVAAARASLDQIRDESLRFGAMDSIIKVAIDSDPAAVPGLLGEAEIGLANSAQFLYQSSASYFNGTGISYGHGTWGAGGYYGGNLVFQPNSSGMISEWAKKDPAAAEAYAHGIKDSAKRSAALLAITQARAATDPKGALAFARGLDESEGRKSAMLSAVGFLAQKDPQRASGILDEISGMRFRNQMLTTVAAAWIAKDRAAGLAWLESLPSSQAKSQAYNTAIYQIVGDDPQTAINLLDHAPLQSRNQMIPRIATSWAAKDLDAAREWVVGIEDPTAMNAGFNSIFGVWAKEDPQGASEFLANSGEVPIQNRGNHYSTVANLWVKEDEQGALAWAQGIADEDGRRMALSSLYTHFAISDPVATAGQLDSIDDPVQRKALLNSLATQWSSKDPQATLEWYDQLSGEDHAALNSNIVHSLAYSSPQDAATLLDRMVTAATGDDEKLSKIRSNANTIASQWSQNDPVAAADWAINLDDEPARVIAVEQVANTWIQFDPVGASGWISELPAGDLRDGAAKKLVDSVAHVDPASAFEWAQSIGSAEARFSATQTAINRWRHTDKESAREAVARAGNLTSEQRETLQAQLK